MKKISGIYKITNIINGKFYIGSAVNIKKRWKEHKQGCENKNVKRTNVLLINAWNKYGKENFVFEVLEECSIELLIEREQFYLDEWKPYKREIGYNICSVAGSTLGIKFSDETRKKMSKRMLGENNHMFGKTGELSPMFGKIGKLSPMFGKTGELSPMFGLHFSQEVKNKISESLKGKMAGEKNPMFGKCHSQETKQKIREATSKLTEQQVLEIREKYASGEYTQKELGEKYDINDANVSYIINNKTWKHI